MPLLRLIGTNVRYVPGKVGDRFVTNKFEDVEVEDIEVEDIEVEDIEVEDIEFEDIEVKDVVRFADLPQMSLIKHTFDQ